VSAAATPALFAALFAAQRAVQPVPKGAEFDAGKYGYRYAPSGAVVEYARAHLHDHGLALVLTATSTMPSAIDGNRGVVGLSGVLWHTSGESIPVSFELPYVGAKGRPDDKASQASITTGEARLYRLLLGLTTADEDAEVASWGEREPEPPTTRRPLPTAPPLPDVPALREPLPAPRPTPTSTSSPTPTPTKGAEQTPSSDEDSVRFDAIAKRLRLDPDVAVSWGSRTPTGAKLKAATGAVWHTYSDAQSSGVLGDLAAVLEADAVALKARRINPKDGWAAAVTAWAADLIPF